MDGSYEHGKEKYLIAPFEDGRKHYKCECKSCQLSFEKHNLPQRLFWIGLFIPFALIYEIGLYFYVHFYLSHRILQPNLTEQDYPTEYERRVYLERHEVNLKMNNLFDINTHLQENSEPDDDIDNIFLEETSRASTDKLSHLDLFKYEFMKQVAADIVDSHDYYRSHFLTWTLRCFGALIGQVIVIVIVVVLCVNQN